MTALDTLVAPPRIDFDRDVEALRDDDPGGYDNGWFCIATAPFPCPAPGCDFVARHMTAAHMILVWPRADDPMLLTQARNAQLVGRSPRVVEYERSMGPCVSWDQWARIGRPVHGKLAAPDGWADARERSRL